MWERQWCVRGLQIERERPLYLCKSDVRCQRERGSQRKIDRQFVLCMHECVCVCEREREREREWGREKEKEMFGYPIVLSKSLTLAFWQKSFFCWWFNKRKNGQDISSKRKWNRANKKVYDRSCYDISSRPSLGHFAKRLQSSAKR